MAIWENIIWVYDQAEDKKLITADFRPWINLEKELNLTEDCDSKIDNVKSKCEQRMKQLDATMLLLGLQSKLEKKEVIDDIDLIYDEKLDKFRFRLFNNNDLTLDIDLDNTDTHDPDLAMTQMEKIWEILVELINNIDDLVFEDDNLPKYKNYQEIAADGIVLNSHIVSTESLKEVFYFNPNEEYPWVQANNIFNKIKYTIQDAKQYRDSLKNKWIEIK